MKIKVTQRNPIMGDNNGVLSLVLYLPNHPVNPSVCEKAFKLLLPATPMTERVI